MRKDRLLSITLVSFLLICCIDVQGTTSNHLYVESANGWTKHLEVPQGTIVSLVLFAKEEGNGYLNDLSPDGSLITYNHYFCECYESLPFSLNTPGQHVLSYIINGRESNSVIIDVTANYPPIAPKAGTYAPINYPPLMSNAGTYTSTDYLTPYIVPISLGKSSSSYPLDLHYNPVGSHVMNFQNGITMPPFASKYYFGREFSLGTIDSNYPGTPFLTQFLADP